MWMEWKKRNARGVRREKQKEKYLVQALELQEMGKFTCFNLTECKLFSSQFPCESFFLIVHFQIWFLYFCFRFFSLHFSTFLSPAPSLTWLSSRLSIRGLHVYNIHHVCFNDFSMNLIAVKTGRAQTSIDIKGEPIKKKRETKENWNCMDNCAYINIKWNGLRRLLNFNSFFKTVIEWKWLYHESKKDNRAHWMCMALVICSARVI